MSAPAFSVVVPAYNAARTLPAAIASVRAQTERDFEVVIVDDGSTDATGEVAERLAHGEDWQVIHQANGGLPAARNAGVRAARGHRLAFLDSDDLLMPAHLERMGALLDGGPDVGLAFCDAWMFDERRGRVYRRSAMGPYRPDPVPEAPEPFFRALLRTNFVYVAAAAPRAVIEAMGGFDESLRAAEDWQMWLRVTAAGHRAASTADRLGIYRRSAGQMSGDPVRMFAGRLAAIRSLHGTVPPALEAAVREREAEAEAELARARPAGGRGVLRTVLAPAITLRNFHRRLPAEVAEVLRATGTSP